MRIDLQIAITPDEMENDLCGICEETFDPGSVLAMSSFQAESVCPACLEALHGRCPFSPNVRELEQAKRDFPDPVFASAEESDQAEKDGTYWELVAQSRLVPVTE